jgi:hypothetical protein
MGERELQRVAGKGREGKKNLPRHVEALFSLRRKALFLQTCFLWVPRFTSLFFFFFGLIYII